MTQAEARTAIKTRFRRAVDRDVSLLVHDRLLEHGHGADLERCAGLNESVSDALWSGFAAARQDVTPNPGGTSGRAAAFLQLKTELVYRLALDGADAQTAHLERDLKSSLNVLWLEWAGYMVTPEPELIVALD